MGTHPIFESDFDCLTDMSKRAPGSTLTHDNWNDEYQTEEAGTFQRASTSTLKERVIMKARRKAKTQDTSNGASAFAGFGAKFKQEEPKEDPKSEETIEHINASEEVTVNSSESLPSETATTDSAPSTADTEVQNLNLALLKWIDKHLNENAVCDMRPIFDDYKRHMEKIDKKYGTSWTDVDEPETVELGNPDIETPQSDEKREPESAQNDATKETAPEKPSTAPFSFGKAEGGKPFSFGKAEENKSEGSAPKFVFNPVASESKSASATPLFSFKPKSDPSSAGSEAKSTPKPSFFSNLPSADSAPKPFGGFSFASSSNGTNGSTAPSGFSFGSGGFKPMSESKTGTGEGDEYEPPKVEQTEFDDAKDSLYQKKAKIFYSKDGAYKEIGVGQLFVKPLEDNKGSILVRADNTLGNILLNISIPKAPAPASVGKNNCLITTVPNPPIEGVEGAVPILIRVKTGEDRDELIEVIKSRQN